MFKYTQENGVDRWGPPHTPMRTPSYPYEDPLIGVWGVLIPLWGPPRTPMRGSSHYCKNSIPLYDGPVIRLRGYEGTIMRAPSYHHDGPLIMRGPSWRYEGTIMRVWGDRHEGMGTIMVVPLVWSINQKTYWDFEWYEDTLIPPMRTPS